MVGTLHFDNMVFYGFHGLYPSEVLTGTRFTISIKAEIPVDWGQQKPSLESTIDYENLYKVVQNTFSKREDLIEQVTLNIYNALSQGFPLVTKWLVRVEKENPLGKSGFNPAFQLSDFA